MEYFVISAKFVPLKYYTLSSQLRRLTSFSVGCSGRRILSPGQIAVMRKWSIPLSVVSGLLTNADKSLLSVPGTKSSLGDRTFSVVAQKRWNSLPTDLRQATSLKTFLFNNAYC